jgi:hypothetical protein
MRSLLERDRATVEERPGGPGIEMTSNRGKFALSTQLRSAMDGNHR